MYLHLILDLHNIFELWKWAWWTFVSSNYKHCQYFFYLLHVIKRSILIISHENNLICTYTWIYICNSWLEMILTFGNLYFIIKVPLIQWLDTKYYLIYVMNMLWLVGCEDLGKLSYDLIWTFLHGVSNLPQLQWYQYKGPFIKNKLIQCI